jgi:hypothetical protein
MPRWASHHEAHAEEVALEESPHEARPGVALVIAGREVETQDAALTGPGDPDRDEDGHRDHPPAIADLDVGRVEPEVGIALAGEGPMAEGLDLGVEAGADPADLALADAGDPQGGHEVLHAARRDARDVGLLDHRKEGSLGPSAGLQEGGKVAPVADPRDGEVEGPDAGVPAPLAIAVAVGDPPVRVALAPGHAGELRDLGLHHRLGKHAYALPQEVDVALGDRLAHRFEHAHPVIGHRGVPPCRRLLLQRREDDAVAASVPGLAAVTPSLGTQPS